MKYTQMQEVVVEGLEAEEAAYQHYLRQFTAAVEVETLRSLDPILQGKWLFAPLVELMPNQSAYDVNKQIVASKSNGL